MTRLLKRIIKKLFLHYLLKTNITDREIEVFTMEGDLPTLVLRDGTRLSSHGKRGLPAMTHLGIPAGHQEVALAYINRYKYPHFAPERVINTSFLPRRWLPLFIHPQHKNTFTEIPAKQRRILGERIPVRQGDTVLEVGCFIGMGTIQMSRIVGAEGQIVSIEADSAAFKVLHKNIRQNGLTNVRIYNYAIGDNDEDDATFWSSKMQANSLIERTDATPVPVKMRKLTSVIDESSIVPTFIILTINGFELQALASCRDFLRETRPLRIITPGWYKDSKGFYGPRIIALLKSLGFTVYHTPGMHIFAFNE